MAANIACPIGIIIAVAFFAIYAAKVLIPEQQVWFDKIKDLSGELGYAREVKEYKENPDNYKGHVGDVSSVIRIALTTKSMTPNLYDIMKLFGKERILKRIEELEKNI